MVETTRLREVNTSSVSPKMKDPTLAAILATMSKVFCTRVDSGAAVLIYRVRAGRQASGSHGETPQAG